MVELEYELHLLDPNNTVPRNQIDVKPASNLVNHPSEVWLDNGEEMV